MILILPRDQRRDWSLTVRGRRGDPVWASPRRFFMAEKDQPMPRQSKNSCVVCSRDLTEYRFWEYLYQVCAECCLQGIQGLLREGPGGRYKEIDPGVCVSCGRDLRGDTAPVWHVEAVVCVECMKESGKRVYKVSI